MTQTQRPLWLNVLGFIALAAFGIRRLFGPRL